MSFFTEIKNDYSFVIICFSKILNYYGIIMFSKNIILKFL